MIFGYIENENIVQANDKTRISATKSFVSREESKISRVELSPFGDLEDFIGRRYEVTLADYVGPGQFVLTVNQTLYTVPYTSQQNRLDELEDLATVISANEFANEIAATVVDGKLKLVATGFDNDFPLVVLEGVTITETILPGGFDPSVGGFITVGEYASNQTPKPSEWFIDWQYLAAQAGAVKLLCRITTDGTPQIFESSLTLVTAVQDLLWSGDQDLMAHEPDILKWVNEGRSSFLNVHRKAQTAILEWLDAIRIFRDDGSRLQKQDIKVTTDVKELSVYYALHFIFKGLQNKPDDIFGQKASDYLDLVKQTKGRGRIQADQDQDDEIDESEKRDLQSFRIYRR